LRAGAGSGLLCMFGEGVQGSNLDFGCREGSMGGSVGEAVLLPTGLLVLLNRGVNLCSKNLDNEVDRGASSSGRLIGVWRLVWLVGGGLAFLLLELSLGWSVMVKARGSYISRLASWSLEDNPLGYVVLATCRFQCDEASGGVRV
jgi:hypothetical protein